MSRKAMILKALCYPKSRKGCNMLLNVLVTHYYSNKIEEKVSQVAQCPKSVSQYLQNELTKYLNHTRKWKKTTFFTTNKFLNFQNWLTET